jgi:hypothetical protein
MASTVGTLRVEGVAVTLEQLCNRWYVLCMSVGVALLYMSVGGSLCNQRITPTGPQVYLSIFKPTVSSLELSELQLE